MFRSCQLTMQANAHSPITISNTQNTLHFIFISKGPDATHVLTRKIVPRSRDATPTKTIRTSNRVPIIRSDLTPITTFLPPPSNVVAFLLPGKPLFVSHLLMKIFDKLPQPGIIYGLTVIVQFSEPFLQKNRMELAR